MFGITTAAVFSVFLGKQILVEAALAFTAPMLDTWDVGTTQAIKWIDNKNNVPMPTAITLTLMNGSPALLQVVEVIGTNIPSSAGKYEWAIPTNLPPGKYAIRASGNPDPSYSPFFSVVLSGGSKADLPHAISPNPKPSASSPLQPVTRKQGTNGKSKARMSDVISK